MSEKLMRIQKAYQIPTYKEQLNIIHENISWFMEMYFWYLENENTNLDLEPYSSLRFS